jgi:hypothetical protein
MLCDPDQAEMLLRLAKDFCPDAVPQITTSDQTYVKIKGNDYDIGERATRTIQTKISPRLRLRSHRPKSHRSKNRRREIGENK